MEELNAAIAITSNTRSFDTDGIHLSLIKKMGYKAREMLLQIFNNCWETASWPWKESRVIFIRKPNKERHDDSSSYRPLSISATLINSLNEFWPVELPNTSTCTTPLVKNKEASELKEILCDHCTGFIYCWNELKHQNCLQPCLILTWNELSTAS